LDKKHTFCSFEKADYNPVCGFGLLNEFDIDQPEGFSSTEAGDYFLKLGVGDLLRPNDAPYDFFYPYQYNPMSFKFAIKDSATICFKTISNLVNGFQTVYNKVISINKNLLTIDYYLMNIGDKSFTTEEYCHNFLSIDHEGITADNKLEFNFDLHREQFAAFVDPDNTMTVGKNAISWKNKPVNDLFISELSGKTPQWATWKLTNSHAGVGVCEEINFEAAKVNLWGNGHVVSPELFFRVNLLPGEETRWQRRYTFFYL